jgi:osomolarity two-component system sensor histidine kinase SLN1
LAEEQWINNYRFVVNIRSSGLTLTASLKAAQVSANLLLLQSAVQTVSTRLLIQNALRRYREDGNNTAQNWANAKTDLHAALAGGASLLLQAVIFPSNAEGLAGASPLVNATSNSRASSYRLPYQGSNGSPYTLGEGRLGYPPELYPNLTYVPAPLPGAPNATSAYVFDNRTVNRNDTLLLGPLQIDPNSALLSLTVPIVNNTSASDILGYMTAVVDARLIAAVVTSPEGLENLGEVLLVGPNTPDNKFPPANRQSGVLVQANSTSVEDLDVRFVWSPSQNASLKSRHIQRPFGQHSLPFQLKHFPAVLEAYASRNGAANNAGSILSSINEEGHKVAVGFARITTSICDWVLVVEHDHYQAVSPIRHLRNVLLACVFGTLGVILLLVFPIAHISVRPIRRLRQATKESVEPPGYGSDDIAPRPSSVSRDDVLAMNDRADDGDEKELHGSPKASFLQRLSKHWRSPKKRDDSSMPGLGRRRQGHIRIPRRVQDRKHFVQDELTDLTETFNAMSDELMLQYEQLEQRVRERTRELELSKRAAEAANESKTLFVANISHEFRTPLNAILGLTAVCMEEDDLRKVKRSLGIIYRSGDLLLHLLTDLLTFSKNQIGQQLTLEEREFRLADIGQQISSIFEKQAREGNIMLRTTYGAADASLVGDGNEVLFGAARAKDVCVWGDQNRILQVIINLVSNSLKFTPPGKSITFRVRCLGETDSDRSSRKASASNNMLGVQQQQGRLPDGALHSVAGEGTTLSPEEIPSQMNTALAINPLEAGPLAKVRSSDRSPSPSPHARTMLFEFEVEDTGPGIPDHLQARIFEPFVQGDLGLSKKYGGTGLGLSICSQLAKLMGGSITLRSQVGVGSTFIMRIPLKVTRSRPPSSSSSMSNLHSRTNSNLAPRFSDDTAVSPRLSPGSGISPLSDQPPSAPTMNGSSSDGGTSFGTDTTGNNTSIVSASANNTRLVGLSQPFFAPSRLTESPDGDPPTTGISLSAGARTAGRVRVLVAEDNQVNQEVVLQMLKLEDIYGMWAAMVPVTCNAMSDVSMLTT